MGVLSTYSGPFQRALGLLPLPLEDWALVCLIAVVGTGWMEAVKLLRWRERRPPAYAMRALAATARPPHERTALLAGKR